MRRTSLLLLIIVEVLALFVFENMRAVFTTLEKASASPHHPSDLQADLHVLRTLQGQSLRGGRSIFDRVLPLRARRIGTARRRRRQGAAAGDPQAAEREFGPAFSEDHPLQPARLLSGTQEDPVQPGPAPGPGHRRLRYLFHGAAAQEDARAVPERRLPFPGLPGRDEEHAAGTAGARRRPAPHLQRTRGTEQEHHQHRPPGSDLPVSRRQDRDIQPRRPGAVRPQLQRRQEPRPGRRPSRPSRAGRASSLPATSGNPPRSKAGRSSFSSTSFPSVRDGTGRTATAAAWRWYATSATSGKKERIRRHNDNLMMLGEMAASLAHEIRNSLGVILGYSKALSGEPEKTRKIVREIQFMSEMMESFLRFARPVDKVSAASDHLGQVIAAASAAQEMPSNFLPDPRAQERPAAAQCHLHQPGPQCQTGRGQVACAWNSPRARRQPSPSPTTARALPRPAPRRYGSPSSAPGTRAPAWAWPPSKKLVSALNGDIQLLNPGEPGARFRITFYT